MTDFVAGDRVRITSRLLEEGRLFGKIGTVSSIDGALWPLNVTLDDDQDCFYVGNTPLAFDEVEKITETKGSEELRLLREELNEEKHRSERFSREMSEAYDMSRKRLSRIRELEQQTRERDDTIYDLRQDVDQTTLQVKLWMSECVVKEQELAELKCALAALSS